MNVTGFDLTIRTGALQLKQRESLLKAIQIANSFGLRSLKQFELFLTIAYSPAGSLSICELCGSDASTKEYKALYGIFNKLYRGSRDRSRNGLRLVEYSELGCRRRIQLSQQGALLKGKLDLVLDSDSIS